MADQYVIEVQEDEYAVALDDDVFSLDLIEDEYAVALA